MKGSELGKKNFDDLVKLMNRLRGPGGCPWDREQTHKSLKPYLIEETYEVIEAIDEKSTDMLREELGDLLLQVVFHSELARERGDFDVYDVIEELNNKLVSRHPHVFGETEAKTAEDVLAQWHRLKKEEAKIKGRESILEGIPPHLPALLKAHKVTEKAARVGFDWEHVDQVFEKVKEEMGEFEEAFKKKDPKEMEGELGDLLFALVNIGRFIEVNPEEALRKTISRFMRRFRYIEESLAQNGKDFKDVSLQEMDQLWNEAKSLEK
jgi:tetrapyrrole methylase family protein/MazG family protein